MRAQRSSHEQAGGIVSLPYEEAVVANTPCAWRGCLAWLVDLLCRLITPRTTLPFSSFTYNALFRLLCHSDICPFPWHSDTTLKEVLLLTLISTSNVTHRFNSESIDCSDVVPPGDGDTGTSAALRRPSSTGCLFCLVPDTDMIPIPIQYVVDSTHHRCCFLLRGTRTQKPGAGRHISPVRLRSGP